MLRRNLVITLVAASVSAALIALSTSSGPPVLRARQSVVLEGATFTEILDALIAGRVVLTEHGAVTGYGPLLGERRQRRVASAQGFMRRNLHDLRGPLPETRAAFSEYYAHLVLVEYGRAEIDALRLGRVVYVGRDDFPWRREGYGTRTGPAPWGCDLDPESLVAVPDRREWQDQNRKLGIFCADLVNVGAMILIAWEKRDYPLLELADRRRGEVARGDAEQAVARFNALPLERRRQAHDLHHAAMDRARRIDADRTSAAQLLSMIEDVETNRLPPGIAVSAPDFEATVAPGWGRP